MLKRFITYILLFAGIAASASTTDNELIPRPVPPDTLMNLQPRCDFIVNRFWDRTNFEQAILFPEQLNTAFGEFTAVLPLASADTVHAAIDRLLARVSKSGPQTLRLAELAESWMYSDTSQYRSEETYLPFAKAAANNKKISKADKSRFAAQTKVIETSGLGAIVPDLKFIRPDGSKGSLAEADKGSVLIFINEPDCADCNMARVRLSADYNINQLIKSGEMTIVSIYPGEADDEQWKNAVSSYPDTWIVGAMPDADLYFDLRDTPQFLFLNKEHKVLVKNVPVDHFLNAAYQVINSKNNRRNR